MVPVSPTTIRYSLDRNDLMRARLRGLFAVRSVWIIVLVVSAFTAWNDFTSAEMAGKPLPVKIIASLIAAAIVAGVGFLGGFLVLLAGLAKKNRGLLGEHTIELTDAGLVERTETNETLHRWSAFDRIFTTSHYLYIYVTDTNYHIIPLRAFASAEHFTTFRSELDRLSNAAKSLPK